MVGSGILLRDVIQVWEITDYVLSQLRKVESRHDSVTSLSLVELETRLLLSTQ